LSRDKENVFSEEILAIAQRALVKNWPEADLNLPITHERIKALAAMCEHSGKEKFELYYNLRKPKERLEEWNRDFFQQRLSAEEYKTCLKNDVDRPVDLDMVTTFHEAIQEKIEHYSVTLQTISQIVSDQRNPDIWVKLEPIVDEHVSAISANYPQWKEHLEKVMEFLEEIRVRDGIGLARAGEFQATSAHWLAMLVFERIEKGWNSCKEIAHRSRTDPNYLYATTASQLFNENHFSLLPKPQDLLEITREEFLRVRIALKSNTQETKSSKSQQDAPQTNRHGNMPPTAFISYSWDDDSHKEWTRELASRLRADGVDVKLDQWEALPGDQLPEFMERAIVDNDYVLIICTPDYKKRADRREGGVGYEGDIITAELLGKRNHRKFIPVLRSGAWSEAVPTALGGKYGIDLRGNPYSETQYQDLIVTLHGTRKKAPPIGKSKQVGGSILVSLEVQSEKQQGYEPITIEGIVVDEVGEPMNDGSQGSALYEVPFKLSQQPDSVWSELLIKNWDHPPKWTTRHRPGIASVKADRIILGRTTIEEVRDVHRDTLILAVEETNNQKAKIRRKNEEAAEKELEQREQHLKKVEDVAQEIDFQ